MPLTAHSEEKLSYWAPLLIARNIPASVNENGFDVLIKDGQRIETLIKKMFYPQCGKIDGKAAADT